MKVIKTINVDIIKARVNELQSDVDRVKNDLVTLKDASKGSIKSEDVQKIDELTRELLTFKAAQAELINLLQE